MFNYFIKNFLTHISMQVREIFLEGIRITFPWWNSLIEMARFGNYFKKTMEVSNFDSKRFLRISYKMKNSLLLDSSNWSLNWLIFSQFRLITVIKTLPISIYSWLPFLSFPSSSSDLILIDFCQIIFHSKFFYSALGHFRDLLVIGSILL